MLTLLAALGILAVAALRGLDLWLSVRRLEIERRTMEPSLGQRIEMADLGRRVRKLETIAAGIDP
jgi:hypothetical protein